MLAVRPGTAAGSIHRVPGRATRDVNVMGRLERAMQDEKLKRAIHWISECLQEQPGADRVDLIDTASRQFVLSPKQEEFLHHMYLKAAWRGVG